MRSRLKVLTLAVNDLQESLAFYRDGLGLKTDGIIGEEFEDGAVVFINMNDYAAGLIFLGLLAGAFVHHHAQVVCFGLWRPLAVYLTPALYLLQLYALHRLTI